MKRFIKLFFEERLQLLAIPAACFLIGFSLNQTVFISNGGKFPVMLNESRQSALFSNNRYLDEIHVIMDSGTKFNWLADVFHYDSKVLSPGDIMLGAGMFSYPYFVGAWLGLLLGDVKRATGILKAVRGGSIEPSPAQPVAPFKC